MRVSPFVFLQIGVSPVATGNEDSFRGPGSQRSILGEPSSQPSSVRRFLPTPSVLSSLSLCVCLCMCLYFGMHMCVFVCVFGYVCFFFVAPFRNLLLFGPCYPSKKQVPESMSCGLTQEAATASPRSPPGT